MKHLILAALLLASPAGAEEVWLGGSPPEYRASQGWPPNDLMALFAGAKWPTVAARVTEYRMTSQFARSPADVAAAAPFLKAHPSIKVALQIAPLVEGVVKGQACGHATESYNPAAVTMQAVDAIAAAGLTLDAVVMDEPLNFGHFGGCQYPVAEVARQAVARLRLIQAVFPNVRFGNVEPISAAGQMLPVLAEWLADLQQAGQTLAFLQLDVTWSDGPVKKPQTGRNIVAAAAIIHAAGAGVGLDYKGRPSAGSDAIWAAQARTSSQQGVSLGIVIEQAVFESWTKRPIQTLPETVPSSLTGVVLTYLAAH